MGMEQDVMKEGVFMFHLLDSHFRHTNHPE